MLKVTFYSKEQCPLCDKGLAKMKRLKDEFSFDLEVVDIYEDDELLEKYQLMIPVVAINGEQVDYGMIDEQKVKTWFLEKIN
ncbi:glutaredoxin family protein [Halalkalibacterium halodurans]|jgi:glutaredoxin|uniref:glutaredoxin family protein n=1 Tax=Halalkalibacterium halodurans TaxID=86665 RepID=UPI0009FAC2DE|nr:glutaredoxin family protein [Halalkalibacterium halodurans]MDY7224041.1 glutaredoxin family protein [Halalkalibacterium halodurans]MDY7243326.1 glutaredoxin family protein [Halalkalibacterium halodurans]MED3646631.1 glutaredoxin family protein [Halalkalibacterium halodurans]MED4164428.1 glutaredoxin family protein [Halalkalibacterium halodurans]TES48986.1 glutaredoxin family protein [Halalkalibacterium halodurans]